MATSQEIAALAVSLSLDSGNFNKAMSTINKQVKNLDKDFKNAGQGIQNFENTFDGLERKIEVTKTKIDLFNKKLEAQKNAYKSLEGTFDSQRAKLQELEQTLGKGSAEWKKQAELVQRNAEKLSKLGSDINATEGDIKNLNSVLNSSSERLDQMGKKAEQAGEKVNKLGDRLSTAGSNMKNAGGHIAGEFGIASVAIGTGLGLVVKAAADQESQLAKMETAMQGNKQAAKDYVNWATEMAKATPFDTTEVVDATIKLKAYGIDAKKVLTPIGNMAAGMGKGLDQAIEAVADAQTGELERLKEFGITKKMLIDKAAEMGKKEIVNAKGQIIDQKGLNDALFKIMDERFKGGMKRQAETLNGQVSALKDSATQLAASFGEQLMPVAKALAEFLKTIGDKFNSLSPGMKKFIAIGGLVAIAITGIMTAVGVLLSIVGSAIVGLTAISGAFAAGGVAATAFGTVMTVITGPIGIVIAIIAALVVGGIALYKNWDTVKEKASQVGQWLSNVWQSILSSLSKAWNSITSTTSKVWNGIMSFFKKWGTTILAVITGPIGILVLLISKNWNTIKTATSNVWNAIKTAISTAWNNIKSAVSNAMSAVKTAISNAWNAVKSNITNAISSIKTNVQNGFNAVKSTASNVFNAIKSTISNIWNNIKSSISNGVSNIKSAISNGFSGLKNIMTAPFTAAKRVIDGIIGGISSGINKVKSVAGKLLSVEAPVYETPLMSSTPTGAGTMGVMSVAGGVTASGSILDSFSELQMSMGALDFSSSKYTSASGILGAADSAGGLALAKGIATQNKSLERQNDLLLQMVNMLAQGQQIAVNVDGREVARATSSFMDTELRKNRDSKTRARGGK